MDKVYICNLVFSGIHGVMAVEQKRKQGFRIDVTMDVDCEAAAQSDDLKDAVDYKVVRDKLQAIIDGPSQHLLERLAQMMIDAIHEDQRVRKTRLSIRKMEIWENGKPGVELTRENK